MNMDIEEAIPTTYCCGCLCKNAEKSLKNYKIQSESLKSILETDQVILCNICKRIAQHTEIFIKNIQSNQALLVSYQNVNNTFNLQEQPIVTLSRLSLLNIELGKGKTHRERTNSCCDKVKQEMKEEAEDVKVLSTHAKRSLSHNKCENILQHKNVANSNIKLEIMEEVDDFLVEPEGAFVNEYGHEENLEHHKKISNSNVKLETMEEVDDLVESEGAFVDDDCDFENALTKDHSFPLKALLKEEVELEEIDLKTLRKSLKRGKLKCKVKKKCVTKANFQNDIWNKIETICINREQCLQEREQIIKDEKYINSTYKCEDCIKGFNYKPSYEKHREKHTKGDYECDICRQRMDSEDKLMSHKRYHEVRYRCTICDLVRISRSSIKNHFMDVHTNGVLPYICRHCSKVFKRQESLRKHISYVHTTKQRVLCAFCSKTYRNKESLKTHMTLRHPNEVSANEVKRRHICGQCGMAFKFASQLRNHGIKHSARKDYYCVECNKSFKSNYILKHHLRTTSSHITYLELPHACENCEKRFAIRRDLERHRNRVHLNIRPHQCDKCDKAYVNPWSLTEHKRVTHEGYKRPLKYPCSMCDKVFDRKQILKSHIRTHTGEKPYQCSKCPAQFSQSGILATHVKLVHLKLTRDGRPKTALK